MWRRQLAHLSYSAAERERIDADNAAIDDRVVHHYVPGA